MTKIDPGQPSLSLHVRIEERILEPLRRSSAARTWFGVTLLAILALHGGILAALLLRDRSPPDLMALEPTPIEVVVQKAPAPPKPPAPEASPPKQAVIEKPATSAPRAPSETKVDMAALEKETHAPKAPMPPKDKKPEQKGAAAAPDEPAEAKEASAEKPEVSQKQAEALDVAKPKPEKKMAKVAKAAPRHRTRQPSTAVQQLNSASSLPDYAFAKPTKKSRVYGGSEDSRYLAVVYGMIMMHRHPVEAEHDDVGNVTLTFNVDDSGNVIGIGIERSSGDGAIDTEAAAAIRRASPFPPPPPGAPRGLIATIDFSDAGPRYTMGDQDR